jgi:hypothetical protein
MALCPASTHAAFHHVFVYAGVEVAGESGTFVRSKNLLCVPLGKLELHLDGGHGHSHDPTNTPAATTGSEGRSEGDSETAAAFAGGRRRRGAFAAAIEELLRDGSLLRVDNR